MIPIVPVTACPHCGGKNGFYTNVRFKAQRTMSWDGCDVDTDGYVIGSETNPKCFDCDKSVRSLFKNS